jgi:hypothetical protein
VAAANFVRGRFEVVGGEAMRAVAEPLGKWMGRELVVYSAVERTDATPAYALTMAFAPDADQGAFVVDGKIYVSLERLRSFAEPLQLARFLSHAAGHAVFSHAERMSQAQRAIDLLDLSPHAPLHVKQEIADRAYAEIEAEANTRAATFLDASGCATGPCAEFNRLLELAR